jgi:hypothetical protein
MSALENQSLDTLDGRDSAGRFREGHKLSIGNRASLHRRKIDEAISDEDIDLALNGLRRILRDEKAKGQEIVGAARELLDRAGGKPVSNDLAEKIGEIESKVETLLQRMDEQMERVA